MTLVAGVIDVFSKAIFVTISLSLKCLLNQKVSIYFLTFLIPVAGTFRLQFPTFSICPQIYTSLLSEVSPDFVRGAGCQFYKALLPDFAYYWLPITLQYIQDTTSGTGIK